MVIRIRSACLELRKGESGYGFGEYFILGKEGQDNAISVNIFLL
jgi:hypothetical protein